MSQSDQKSNRQELWSSSLLDTFGGQRARLATRVQSLCIHGNRSNRSVIRRIRRSIFCCITGSCKSLTTKVFRWQSKLIWPVFQKKIGQHCQCCPFPYCDSIDQVGGECYRLGAIPPTHHLLHHPNPVSQPSYRNPLV